MKNLSYLLLVTVFLSACAPLPATQPVLSSDTPIVSTIPVIPTETSQPVPTATTEPEPTSTSVPDPQWMAFIGSDGNLRLVDRISGETRAVTTDALAMGAGTADQNSYQYWNPKLSSDGQILAYQREIGVPDGAGYSVTYELWVYQLADGSSRQLALEQRALGIAWKPGTHWLAYGAAYEDGYFTLRGEVDSSKAKGIWIVDVDSGENKELVAPTNIYTLRAPQWSPDGRFVSFEEVWGYEGSGYFAFYDLESQEYISFGEAFGIYDWSPDSTTIVHDDMTYTATGTERVYLRPRDAQVSQQLSPDYELGYAFWPRYDPTGTQVAYFANLGGPENMTFTLFVQPVSGGEPVSLGEFENALYLSWLPDGSGLIMSVGPYESRQVIEVSLADKSMRVLADGDAPDLGQ